MRDLTRNMKQITNAVARGQSFTVLCNGKSIFRIEPVVPDAIETPPHFSLADLETAQFAGPKNLSKKIDEVAYRV